jgi:acyl-CoA dehydrogenase
MEHSFDQEQPTLRRQVRAWVKSHLSSAGDGQLDLESEACRLAKRLGTDGIIAYAVPGKFGADRESVHARNLCVIREELAWGSALADVMFGVQALGASPIALAGC